jgi:TatD DNase family protein
MFIDAHAHLDRYDLEGESSLETALHEIDQNRIFTLSNSMDVPSHKRNLEIAERSQLILPIFGIHPWNAHEYVGALWELDEPIAKSPILGEIGLDYHFIQDARMYPLQRQVLGYFLIAAQDQQKIVCLHTKGAEEAVLEMIGCYKLPGLLVHWYSGPEEIFKEFIARDAFFTFGVELLYSEHIQHLARWVPLDRLLTETDNPGGPKSLIGRPGMPNLIVDIVAYLAELRNQNLDRMIEIIHSNLINLFQRDPKHMNPSLELLELE